MHHLVFGINFQIHSDNSTILVLIHLLIHLSTHLSHHPGLIIHHSFTLLLHFTTFSTNPSHLRLPLPIGVLRGNGTGPGLSRSSFYF